MFCNMILQVLVSGAVFPVSALLTGLLKWPVVMNDGFLLSLGLWIGLGVVSGVVSSVAAWILPHFTKSSGIHFAAHALPKVLAYPMAAGRFSFGILLSGVLTAIFITFVLYLIAARANVRPPKYRPAGRR